jgi:hypothetical protein
MIPKDVNALGNIAESLERERKESPTPITTVAVPASHTRKPELVAFTLAETIGLGKFAGCHLFYNEEGVFGCKYSVGGFHQANQRRTWSSCILGNANESRCT